MSFYSLHKGSTTYNETNCKIVVMVTLHIASIDWGRFQDGNSVRPSPTENKAWCKPNLNHSSIQVVQVRWFLNWLARGMAFSCHSQVNHRGGGSVATRYAWFLDRTPSAPRMWGHCWWPVTQVAGGVSPSPSLWTCTIASESAGSSVSYSSFFFIFFTFTHLTPCATGNSLLVFNCIVFVQSFGK